MTDPLLIFLMLINGFETIAFFPFLLKIFRKTNRHFYILWGSGFLLYGINVLIRVALLFTGSDDPIYRVFGSFPFLISGFILMITGIGDLVNRSINFLIFAMLIPISIFVLYFTSGPEIIGRVLSISPYLLISMSLLYIKVKFTVPIDLLIVGWIIVLIANIALPTGMMDAGFVEILVIFGKAVIFLGMTYQNFPFLVDNLRNFLIAGIPVMYHKVESGGLILLNSTSGQRSKEIQWLKNKIEQNSLRAVRTILITMYDLISPSDLEANGIREKDLYQIRLLPGFRSQSRSLEEHVLTLNDDLNELDILLSEILNFSISRGINCEIYLYTLSAMIHTHGWKRVYSFLLPRISQLKANKVQLLAFYSPEAHDDKAVVTTFERLGERVIEI